MPPSPELPVPSPAEERCCIFKPPGSSISAEPLHARRATLVTSQLPVEHWHALVGDPTFEDAILDRLLHNAHRITFEGGSMRRIYDATKEKPPDSENSDR